MILIAESGSTKTDWHLVGDNNFCKTFETIGFNPYFISSEKILNELVNSNLTAIKNNVKQVFFYGAGCSTPTNCHMINNPLQTFFTSAKIQVSHDILAAARACCGTASGMVAILGTGANSCLYNGNKITDNISALGFILGDYGSGADIGKTFIKNFLANELPPKITNDFINQYHLNINDILVAVYQKKLPNRYLASFSYFVFQHINNEFIKKMVADRFCLFFEKNICKYNNYQQYNLHLVGSIAFTYQEIIKNIALKYNVKVDNILKHPIEELVKYHQLKV